MLSKNKKKCDHPTRILKSEKTIILKIRLTTENNIQFFGVYMIIGLS